MLQLKRLDREIDDLEREMQASKHISNTSSPKKKLAGMQLEERKTAIKIAH